jgi:hypothetical protein
MDAFHATTIVSVRKGTQVAIAGDGQVSLGNTVAKADAVKVRKLDELGADKAGVLVGFALMFANFKRSPRLWHFGARATRFWPTAGWAVLGFGLLLGIEGSEGRFLYQADAPPHSIEGAVLAPNEKERVPFQGSAICGSFQGWTLG